MSNVSTHALDRAIRQLSTGGVLSLDAKRQNAGYDSLQEITQQFQVPISGTAASGIGWTTVKVPFDVTFVFAPEQRDNPLAVPHFSYGPVLSGEPSDPARPDANNPDHLVAVFCHVTDWARDDHSDSITGAVLGIGVSTIGGGSVDFDGYVHLTFQGYGAPSEAAPDPNIDPGPTS